MELYDKISDAYYAHKYEEVVSLIEGILKSKGKLNVRLNLMLVVAYLKLGKKEEALKYKEILNKKNKRADFKLTEAIHYNKHYLFMEAKEALLECIEDGIETDLVYSYLGKVYFRLGDLVKASICLKRALDLNPDKVTINAIKETLDRIDDILKKKKYIKMNYEYFKEMGRILTTGMIVYLKNYASVKSNVPYLIYKVVDNKVMAFSLSSIVIPETYHIEPKSNTGELSSYLTGNMVMFNRDEIDNIVSEVYTAELCHMKKMLVRYYSTRGNLNIYQKEFLADIKSNLSINDVIVLASNGYITGYLLFRGYDENDNYKCFKLDIEDGLFVPASDISIFAKTSLVCSVVKITEEIQNNILAQINSDELRRTRKYNE